MEFVEHLEMYKMASTEYGKLLLEGKEKTTSGIDWFKEMDYWWSRLSPNQKKECIDSAKKELTEAFSKSYEKSFPKDNKTSQPSSNDGNDAEKILEKIIKELEAEVGE